MSVYQKLYIDHKDTRTVRVKPNAPVLLAWDELENDISVEPEGLTIIHKPEVLVNEEYDALMNLIDSQYVRVRSKDFTEIL